jgi:hypothetical protein
VELGACALRKGAAHSSSRSTQAPEPHVGSSRLLRLRPPPPPSVALSLAAGPPAPYTLRELSPLPAASPSPAPRFTAPLHCSSDPCVLFDRLCSRIQTDWRRAYTGSIFADTTGIVRILIRMVHGLRMLRFDWEVMKCLLFFFARIDCCFAAF